MTNLHDYLIWRGDIPISKKFPFNEIDSLALARFAYLPFDKIFLLEEETMESISKKMMDVDDKKFMYKGDKELIKLLGTSTRFKKFLVTDWIKNSDKNVEKQFGAILIHLPDNILYISYVGTDLTINGWKEDFNMAFMDNVPCQISGLEYLKKVATKYPEYKLRIGGHSKGGNIAIYSSMAAPNDIQNRIIKVDNFDGPGFNQSVIDEYNNEKIIPKMETYIPQESIIGRLLNHIEKITICESNGKGLFQHDIYSWHVVKSELIKLDKTTKASENINSTVIEWLKTTSKEQRKIFIDTIFEVLEGSEVDSFVEIVSSITITIPKILKKYKELDEKDKKVIAEMTKKFITSYISVLKKKRK